MPISNAPGVGKKKERGKKSFIKTASFGQKTNAEGSYLREGI